MLFIVVFRPVGDATATAPVDTLRIAYLKMLVSVLADVDVGVAVQRI